MTAKDDDKDVMKTVVTGSTSDPLAWQDHIRSKPRREGASLTGHWPSGSGVRKYGYPPDKQEKATQPVLQQTKLLCKDWAS